MLYFLANNRADNCAKLGVRAIPLLVQAYHRGLVRDTKVCDLMGKLEVPEAVEALIEVLRYAIGNDVHFLRVQAILSLIHIGEPARQPVDRALQMALARGDEEFAGGALTILTNLQKKGDDHRQGQEC